MGGAAELLYEVPYVRKVGLVAKPAPDVPGWKDIILAIKKGAANPTSKILTATSFSGTASLLRR